MQLRRQVSIRSWSSRPSFLPRQGMEMNQGGKNQKNPLNFKIVKCKNFEKDGTCKYGSHCTFAHGDNDLRSKADNYTNYQPSSNMMGQNNFMYDYGMMQMGCLKILI